MSGNKVKITSEKVNHEPTNINGFNNFVDISNRVIAPPRRPDIVSTILSVHSVSTRYEKMPFGMCIARKTPCWFALPALTGKASRGGQDVGTVDDIKPHKMNLYPGMMLGIANKSGKKVKGLLLYVYSQGENAIEAFLLSPEDWPSKYQWMEFPWFTDSQIGAMVIPPLQQIGRTAHKISLVGCRIDHFRNEDLNNVEWAKSDFAQWTGVDSEKLGNTPVMNQPPVSQPFISQPFISQPVATQYKEQTERKPTGLAQIGEQMAENLKQEEGYLTSIATKWLKDQIPGSKMTKEEIVINLGRILVDARIPEVRDKLLEMLKEQI